MPKRYHLNADNVASVAAQIAGEVITAGKSTGWSGRWGEVEALSAILSSFNIGYTDSESGTWEHVPPHSGPGLSDILADGIAEVFRRRRGDQEWCRRFAETALANETATPVQVCLAWRAVFDRPFFGLEGGEFTGSQESQES